MDRRLSDVCLALGATESFLPGAVVAVASFLKQHPGFGGGGVLFHDGLPEARCAALERAFPPLRCEPVNAELRERLACLGAATYRPLADEAFALWYEAWLECLVSGHLRAAARRRPEERGRTR